MIDDRSSANVGAVVSVRGSVVDVRFDGRLPPIHSVLRTGEEELNGSFHRLRQSSIDEELFDVISGVEALSRGSAPKTTDTRRGGTS